MNKGRLHHKRHNDFESFDRIELKVVPRYKTSGLSGDEWRTSVKINFYFKDELVHETSFTSMEAALMCLPREWLDAQCPVPQRVIDMEYEGKCDQPGCSNDSVSKYRLKEIYSKQGYKIDKDDIYSGSYRQFCKRHLKRGDCGREDSDANYEILSGPGPDKSENLIESPSSIVILGED